MKPPATGALRTRLTLLQPLDGLDDNGGFTQSYVPLASLWGEIVPTHARDRFRAGRMEVSITHHITLRAFAGLTGEMRLATATRSFLIHGLEDVDALARFVLCHCEEIRP
ncbi:MAG: phage head closure protein [Hyphomicrobiales bacterium]|nr:phage head closure protein [Hyphomicrobiales bacterium]